MCVCAHGAAAAPSPTSPPKAEDAASAGKKAAMDAVAMDAVAMDVVAMDVVAMDAVAMDVVAMDVVAMDVDAQSVVNCLVIWLLAYSVGRLLGCSPQILFLHVAQQRQQLPMVGCRDRAA